MTADEFYLTLVTIANEPQTEWRCGIGDDLRDVARFLYKGFPVRVVDYSMTTEVMLKLDDKKIRAYKSHESDAPAEWGPDVTPEDTMRLRLYL